MKIKKTLLAGALVLAGALTFTGCGNSNDGAKEETAKNDGGKASVYYLNFKPEVEEVWKEIATKYEEETGVPVKVVTAASGTYESTLKAEITKETFETMDLILVISYQSLFQRSIKFKKSFPALVSSTYLGAIINCWTHSIRLV